MFNGEIYNHRQLRRELEGLGKSFRSRSDTEAIVRGYEAWGEGVVERLDGMFAFALWDTRLRRLLLARDRFGKKPLYYVSEGSRIIFASTLTALLQHPAVPRASAVAAAGRRHRHKGPCSSSSLMRARKRAAAGP